MARRFFPLDHKLRLRADHWSEGAARVAARQGLHAKSFDLAAQAYGDAVGGAMSADSLRRITLDWGSQVEAQRTAEAQQAGAPGQVGERACDRRLPLSQPLAGAANVSTDGAMVLVRGEGWKEVKLCAISAVTVKAAGERAAAGGSPSRRETDPLVELHQHSYQAGLWDADTLGQQQYAEGLRRGLDQCPRLSSVNDAAPWIERITNTNFPHAVQIVDWSHASGRLWTVAHEVLGAHTAPARQWAETQLDQLWQGHIELVVQVLQDLDLDRERYPAEVQQAPGYFHAHQDRMRYAQFRAEGYPIGSGTVESAANTVVHHRLRRPGRGWQRHAAQAMLAGLSELHSDRFDQAWLTTLLATT